MAEILLFGVNHNDPFGPTLIQKELSEQLAKGFVPTHVAVEWDEQQAKAVIAQRDKLYSMLTDKFIANDQDLHALANTIAYEADCFISLYPECHIIWLDKGRDADKTAITNFAQYRLNAFNTHKVCNNQILDISATRRNLIKTANNNVYKPSKRDQDFFEHMKPALKEPNAKIMCIVGAHHTNADMEGSFADLLNKDGHNVLVIDITAMELPEHNAYAN